MTSGFAETVEAVVLFCLPSFVSGKRNWSESNGLVKMWGMAVRNMFAFPNPFFFSSLLLSLPRFLPSSLFPSLLLSGLVTLVLSLLVLYFDFPLPNELKGVIFFAQVHKVHYVRRQTILVK